MRVAAASNHGPKLNLCQFFDRIMMTGAAAADTFTISCERRVLYLGNIPNQALADQALPLASQFTINANEFTTNSLGSVLSFTSGSVRQTGARYQLRFSFRYQGERFDYTMDYNSNSGSYEQEIVIKDYNIAVGSAEGDCRRV